MLFDPGQSKKVRVKKEYCFQNLRSQRKSIFSFKLCFCTLKINPCSKNCWRKLRSELKFSFQNVPEKIGQSADFLWGLSDRGWFSSKKKKSRKSQNKSQKIGQSCTFVQLTNKRTTTKREIKKNSVKNPLKAEEDREKPGFADWKRNVISGGGVQIRKVAFLLKINLHFLLKSSALPASQPQQLKPSPGVFRTKSSSTFSPIHGASSYWELGQSRCSSSQCPLRPFRTSILSSDLFPRETFNRLLYLSSLRPLSF